MWGAIIQAIDHALGRMNEGAGAGIKVAKSQSGGAAPASNMSSVSGVFSSVYSSTCTSETLKYTRPSAAKLLEDGHRKQINGGRGDSPSAK